MFVAFFSLFSSIVLLPIYLETLMGYTAYLSGLVLGPGGVAAMVAMPIAGQLVNRINPKWIIAFGIGVTAYAVHLMSLFNLEADFYAILWPRVIMGFGIGFLFVPLTTVTMSGVNKEQMGNATAIFNLLRNLGGSFGIAFVTTLLARREQFHQFRLVEHLTPFGRNFQTAVSQIQQFLQYQGFASPVPDQGVVGVIYNNLLQQAAMLSFNDCFFLVSIMMLLLLPFVLLMKKSGKGRVQVTGIH
jgi:DHA2 family multidrug resistance protein